MKYSPSTVQSTLSNRPIQLTLIGLAILGLAAWLSFAPHIGFSHGTSANLQSPGALPKAAQDNATVQPAGRAQQADDNPLSVPTIREYSPSSKLKVKQTLLQSAKFPVIDVHTHPGLRFRYNGQSLAAYVRSMTEHNIAVSVSLDAKLGELQTHLDYLKPHPNRLVAFAHIDFIGRGQRQRPETWACNQASFVETTCRQLREGQVKGICGLKFFKSFGLQIRDAKGKLYPIDAPKWFPIWETCGELGLPVIIHTADPSAFFDPITPDNERYEELSRHPDWSFHGESFPSRDELLAARNRVIKKFPGTKFIGAHVANSAEDLAQVDQWLEDYPNLYVGIASRISELGRQPFTAKKFLEKHQDRVLFGTDGPWPELRLTYYWRFLETHDEYFPYSEKRPQPQGLWHIYGVKLSDEVLRKIYFQNAWKVIPSIQSVYQKACQDLEAAQSGANR